MEFSLISIKEAKQFNNECTPQEEMDSEEKLNNLFNRVSEEIVIGDREGWTQIYTQLVANYYDSEFSNKVLSSKSIKFKEKS